MRDPRTWSIPAVWYGHRVLAIFAGKIELIAATVQHKIRRGRRARALPSIENNELASNKCKSKRSWVNIDHDLTQHFVVLWCQVRNSRLSEIPHAIARRSGQTMKLARHAESVGYFANCGGIGVLGCRRAARLLSTGICGDNKKADRNPAHCIATRSVKCETHPGAPISTARLGLCSRCASDVDRRSHGFGGGHFVTARACTIAAEFGQGLGDGKGVGEGPGVGGSGSRN